MLVQTTLIHSLIQQLQRSSKASPAMSASCSGASLSTLPVELIELVLAHVDTDTLFKLCRVNRLLRALAQPRLISHAQQITMRLWIHQPHVVSHKPIDFRFSHCDAHTNRMVFEPQEATTMMLQTALPPPQIDGCTILIKVSNTRRIYSISYKDRIVRVPIEQGQHEAEYASNDTGCDVEDAYQCGWGVSYDVMDDGHNPMLKRLVPRSFACDTDLMDPQVLIASSREKVVVSLPEPAPETQDQHDEKKKMMEAAQQAPPSWLSRIVNDTMASFYQWLSA